VHFVELPAGGSLSMRDNVLKRGPHAGEGLAAVSVLAPAGAAPVELISLVGNRVQNDTGRSLTLLQNWTGTDAELANNTLSANTVASSSSGYWLFEAKSVVRQALDVGRRWLYLGKVELRRLLRASLG
jgi:hypothetical protein